MEESAPHRLQNYLKAYGVSHQNPTNRWIHKICVPLIMWSLIGILGCFRWNLEGFHLSAAELAALPALIFYRSLGRGTFYLMFAMIAGMIWSHRLLEKISFVDPLLFSMGFTHPEIFSEGPWEWSWPSRGAFYILIFTLAWIGQFVGHRIEGKKPSFLKDVFFLLIGPLWVIQFRRAKD